MEKEKIDRVIDAFRSAMYQEFSVSTQASLSVLNCAQQIIVQVNKHLTCKIFD